MSQQDAIVLLWRASLLLQVVLCGKLLITGLWRIYPRFLWYLVALTAESGLLFFVTRPAWLYHRVWAGTRLILLGFQVLAVVEIFDRWAESHRNIGGFGHKLLIVLICLAAGLSIAMVPVAWSSLGWDFAIYVVSVANRAVQLGAAGFMILMLVFFAKFGGPVAPNLRWHVGAMTAFALANTLGYFLFTTGAVAQFYASILLQAVSIIALIVWTLSLRSSGENAPVLEVNAEESAEAEDLNQQMLDYAETVKQPKGPKPDLR